MRIPLLYPTTQLGIVGRFQYFVWWLNLFSSLQGVLLGPLEKNGLRRVRQYIFIYVHPATRHNSCIDATPWSVRVLLSYVMYVISLFEKRRGACGPSPIGDTQKKKKKNTRRQNTIKIQQDNKRCSKTKLKKKLKKTDSFINFDEKSPQLSFR